MGNRARIRDRIRFGFGLQVQESTLDGIITDQAEISNGYTHFLPAADFHYEVRQGMNMDLRYSTTTRDPSMTELPPFAANPDPPTEDAVPFTHLAPATTHSL